MIFHLKKKHYPLMRYLIYYYDIFFQTGGDIKKINQIIQKLNNKADIF